MIPTNKLESTTMADSNWFELLPVSVGGWLTVLFGGLWLFLSDRIITTRRHDAIIADKNQQIADWKATAEARGTALEVAVKNIDQLVEANKTNNALILGLQKTLERN